RRHTSSKRDWSSDVCSSDLYSREHVLILIFIYYFKNILSIKDIETVLTPLTEKYFSGEGPMDLSSVYKEVCEMEKGRIKPLQERSDERRAGQAGTEHPSQHP